MNYKIIHLADRILYLTSRVREEARVQALGQAIASAFPDSPDSNITVSAQAINELLERLSEYGYPERHAAVRTILDQIFGPTYAESRML